VSAYLLSVQNYGYIIICTDYKTVTKIQKDILTTFYFRQESKLYSMTL